MTKYILAIGTFFNFIILSTAQPVLTGTNFPMEYSSTAYRGSTTGFTNGSSRANQVWDYSAMSLTQTTLSVSLIPVSSMPFQSSFPTANYCYKINDNGLISYDIYKLNNNTFESLGYIDSDILIQYLDTKLIFQFPYTFNTVSNDLYLSNYPDATPQTEIRTYDGYGTLKTSFGTFTNVIRQKVETEGNTSYLWIDSHSFQVILSGNFNDPTVYFYKDNNLGTSQNQNSIFLVYPNPTHDDFTIHLSNRINFETFISVYDAYGKTLISDEKFNEDYKKISLKDFSSGLYIVKITDSKNQILKTEKIIKQ